MLRFAAMLMVSVAVHVLISAALPRIEITLKNPPDDVQIDVELVKALPVPPEMRPGSVGEEPGRLMGDIDDSMLTTDGAAPLVMPELDMPDIETDKSAEIEIPDVRTDIPVDIPADTRADSKIIGDSSSDLNISKTSGGDGLSGEPGSSDGSGEGQRRFFKIEKVAGTSRSLAYIPEQPKFALENDTKVVLQFSINKNGDIHGITFLERTDSRVEKMAIEFVRSMKFNAVLTETNDTARITLYFRVR